MHIYKQIYLWPWVSHQSNSAATASTWAPDPDRNGSAPASSYIKSCLQAFRKGLPALRLCYVRTLVSIREWQNPCACSIGIDIREHALRRHGKQQLEMGWISWEKEYAYQQMETRTRSAGSMLPAHIWNPLFMHAYKQRSRSFFYTRLFRQYLNPICLARRSPGLLIHHEVSLDGLLSHSLASAETINQWLNISDVNGSGGKVFVADVPAWMLLFWTNTTSPCFPFI